MYFTYLYITQACAEMEAEDIKTIFGPAAHVDISDDTNTILCKTCSVSISLKVSRSTLKRRITTHFLSAKHELSNPNFKLVIKDGNYQYRKIQTNKLLLSCTNYKPPDSEGED